MNTLIKSVLCTLALALVLNSCSKKENETVMPIIEETSMTQVTIKTSAGNLDTMKELSFTE